MIIRISETITRGIERHGEKLYPEECCGMILGVTTDDFQSVDSIVEIDNSHRENPRRRFLITPQQYRRAERVAAEQGLEVLGLYHSHPDTPAIPSASDVENALPGFTYIIVSIARGRARGITAWFLTENRSRFVERALAVEATQIRASS